MSVDARICAVMNRIYLLVLFVGACAGAPPPADPRGTAPPPAPQSAAMIADAQPAIAALQASKFDEARSLASQALAKDARNSRAAVVRALATYQAAGHALIASLTQVLDNGDALKSLDHQAGRTAWLQFLAALEAVDRDLLVGSADKDFSMELCLACWEHDWNRNGKVDERDRKLFEIEVDAKGEELPEGDPRRRPTFRFDAGDIEWALAMVSFQRAGVELVLGYQWSELDKLFAWNIFSKDKPASITIKLIDKERVAHAHQLILAGLYHADDCRTLYLAEKDDDREWVPNPEQVNHPVPLPMDRTVYATWAGVLRDVRTLLKSEEGIPLRGMAGLADEKMMRFLPDAYIDVGAMLTQPKDIVIDFGDMSESAQNIEHVLRGVLGNGFKTSMTPSKLVQRLRTMKEDLERGSDTFDKKLRYLLWLN